LGWRSGKFKYLLLGYGLPVCYGIVLYGFVWLTGLGRFSPGEMAEWVAVQWNIEVISPFLIIAIYILISATLGVLVSCLTALGEEIGWRGFLVPHLAKENSFTVTALLSGGIWAIWHFPGILFADYSDGRTPVWFVIIFFTVSALGISFPMAWLRLRSGSLWSPVLLHASHNLFLGSVFTPLTTETDVTAYIVGEFGIGLALLLVLAAWVFWRRRGELPADVSATTETPSP
jgi:membrane protease YdiL (CAAX protease family)